MLRRLGPSLVCLSFLAGCTSASVSPSLRASQFASATPSPEPSANTPPSPGTPQPTSASSASPSLPPLPAPATLPVRGSATKEIGRLLQMIPGPAGGLYVMVPGEHRSVVALLDTSGKPRPGWPVALDEPWCYLPNPAADGSIRLVCGFYSDTVGRAYAFAPDGHPIADWPVDLPGRSPSAAPPVVVVDDLYALGFDTADPTALRLIVVSPDAIVRSGVRYETPSGQDWRAQLGPDGTGYLLALPNEPPDTATGDTEITAFDLGGVREGWLARVKGWSSELGFGPDGHIYLTEGREGERPIRILAFGHDGRSLPIGSEALPVTATSVYGGAGPFGGPPPPVVAEDGTSFLVSEDGGTTVYSLDANGDVLDGWPYRDTVGLQWDYPPGGDTGGASYRSDPAVGPGDVLYLLHPPRAATLGGIVVAIGQDGHVRPGWPVVLKRPGAEFRSVVVAPDGTAYVLTLEPEMGGESSATVLAIAPDSTVRYSSTVVEP